METIIEYLKRNLRAAGPKRWPAIAEHVNAPLSLNERVSENFMRKLAYGDRENPGVKNVQPLLDYFHAVDRGEQSTPTEPADGVLSGTEGAPATPQPTSEPAQAGV